LAGNEPREAVDLWRRIGQPLTPNRKPSMEKCVKCGQLMTKMKVKGEYMETVHGEAGASGWSRYRVTYEVKCGCGVRTEVEYENRSLN
jgi:hypothetical protein